MSGPLTLTTTIGGRPVTIDLTVREIRSLRDHLGRPAVWGGHSRDIEAETMSLREALAAHQVEHDHGQLEQSSTPVTHTHEDGRWLA